MKIYVLSLADDEARRQLLTAQLEALGLTYEVFWAVDGRKGLPEQYRNRVDFDAARLRLGRKLGTGEAACALSHSLIYETILAEGHPCALVLEDDVSVDANLCGFIASGRYQGHDLLLLNHKLSYVKPSAKTPLWGAFHSYPLLLPCLMTAAYIVSAKGAAYLLEQTRTVRSTADWPGNITEIGATVCEPFMVHHPTEIKSNLRSERSKPSRPKRFFSADYWRRWYLKRTSRRIA